MEDQQKRREFLQLMGVGGLVFASGIAGWACGSSSKTAPAGSAGGGMSAGTREDFFFLQLSDTHWGYAGPNNPNASMTLNATIATINAVSTQPDFIIFTGDLTQTTDDPAVRRQRMQEFKGMVAQLAVKDVRYLPGEHDASLDLGAAYKELFGAPYYSFDHKGIHFVALDNVSDPHAAFGDAQLAWLDADLAKYDPKTPFVIFAHRPMFDLYPQWDWATSDGAKAVAILQKYPNVTVFYGHIHQDNTTMTGNIAHYAARSLAWALPAPGSQPMKAPVPWDPTHPYQGLGYRRLAPNLAGFDYALEEDPVKA